MKLRHSSVLGLYALCLFASVTLGSDTEMLVSSRKNDQYPLVFLFQGVHNDSATSLAGALTGPVDRSSISGILEAYATAFKQRKKELFNSLFYPNEQESQFAMGEKDTVDTMKWLGQWNYGPYFIATLQMQIGNRLANDCITLRKANDGYYLSDKLWDDRGHSFVDWIWQDDESGLTRRLNENFEATTGYFTNQTLFAHGNSNSVPPILLLCYGTNYHGKQIIAYTNVTATNYSQASPEEASMACFAAAWTKNSTWYLSLISPAEIDLPKECNNQTKTIRQEVTKEIERQAAFVKRDGPFYFHKVVKFSNYAVVTIKTASHADFLVFKNEAGVWRVTDEMNSGHVVLNLLIGTDTPLSEHIVPKVFPLQ